MTNVLETERLILRRATAEDGEFILALLNDPAWIRFIGDKGVRNLDAARDYITKTLIGMYERLGFGLYLTARKDDGTPVGVCGLIKRDSLPDVDIGFAFLPDFRGRGYAYEAAAAVLAYGQSAFGLSRIVAITTPDNDDSARLLERLGFKFERVVRLSGDDGEELKLFAFEA